jgi:SOS-response transcriptional repressor LexA
MTRKQSPIRLKNLETLIREAGSAASLARAAGTNSSYLSQVRNQLPTGKGTPRSIGDELAAKLEAAMKKPQGWMDENHDDGLESAIVHNGSTASSHHRLISWDQVGKEHDLSENLPPPYGTELLSCPVKCSAETFVLRVRGVSMEPKFREGELIFVDPFAPIGHGKFIVVRLEESDEVTFKQLMLEEGKKYLKTLNPDWPNRIIELKPDIRICGVIVFKGESL